MKKSFKNNSGFTLIELLVVVLIIGILSAVALPQYQKTVLKSRTAEAWANLSAMNKAIEVYCLENPDATHDTGLDKELLSVEVPNSNNFTYDIWSVYCSQPNNRQAYATYSKGGKSFTLGINAEGQRQCQGNNCKDIGFVEYTSTNTDCVCGINPGANGCYFVN